MSTTNKAFLQLVQPSFYVNNTRVPHTMQHKIPQLIRLEGVAILLSSQYRSPLIYDGLILQYSVCD